MGEWPEPLTIYIYIRLHNEENPYDKCVRSSSCPYVALDGGETRYLEISGGQVCND